jgi:hypothetical protein
VAPPPGAHAVDLDPSFETSPALLAVDAAATALVERALHRDPPETVAFSPGRTIRTLFESLLL